MKAILTCTFEIPIDEDSNIEMLKEIIYRDIQDSCCLGPKEIFTIVETTVLEDE